MYLDIYLSLYVLFMYLFIYLFSYLFICVFIYLYVEPLDLFGELFMALESLPYLKQHYISFGHSFLQLVQLYLPAVCLVRLLLQILCLAPLGA